MIKILLFRRIFRRVITIRKKLITSRVLFNTSSSYVEAKNLNFTENKIDNLIEKFKEKNQNYKNKNAEIKVLPKNPDLIQVEEGDAIKYFLFNEANNIFILVAEGVRNGDISYVENNCCGEGSSAKVYFSEKFPNHVVKKSKNDYIINSVEINGHNASFEKNNIIRAKNKLYLLANEKELSKYINIEAYTEDNISIQRKINGMTLADIFDSENPEAENLRKLLVDQKENKVKQNFEALKNALVLLAENGFKHEDLQMGNVMYDQDTECFVVIDWEKFSLDEKLSAEGKQELIKDVKDQVDTIEKNLNNFSQVVKRGGRFKKNRKDGLVMDFEYSTDQARKYYFNYMTKVNEKGGEIFKDSIAATTIQPTPYGRPF